MPRVFCNEFEPAASVPMKLPATVLPDDFCIRRANPGDGEGGLLPEIRFRALGTTPPMTLLVEFVTLIPTELPAATEPAKSVPMKFPSITLLLAPCKRIPLPAKPLITSPRILELPPGIRSPLLREGLLPSSP